MRKEKRRSAPPARERRVTSTGISSGALPSRPETALVRSWSRVPTGCVAALIFQLW